MKKILKGILLLSVIALVYNYFIKADAEVVYGITVEGIQIDPIDMHLHTGTWEALTEPKERYQRESIYKQGLSKQIDNSKDLDSLQSTTLQESAMNLMSKLKIIQKDVCFGLKQRQ